MRMDAGETMWVDFRREYGKVEEKFTDPLENKIDKVEEYDQRNYA